LLFASINFLFPNTSYQLISWILIILTIASTIFLFLKFKSTISNKSPEFEEYSKLNTIIRVNEKSISELEENIVKIEKTANLAIESNIIYIISICKDVLIKKYKKLIKLLNKAHNQEKIRIAKQNYKKIKNKLEKHS